MSKKDLIKIVHNASNGKLTKSEAGDIVDATFDAIKSSIKEDEKFSYPKFGTFTLRHRAPRKGRNPKTGEEIKIPASKTVGFKPSSALKESL